MQHYSRSSFKSIFIYIYLRNLLDIMENKSQFKTKIRVIYFVSAFLLLILVNISLELPQSMN